MTAVEDKRAEEKRVEDKRTAILDATLRLISQHGFHGTAMAKVAAEAGVSAGIIYHYFKSKDELIDELYVTIKRRSATAILVNVTPEIPLPSQLRLALRNILRYFVRHPMEAAFLEQYMRSPYFRPEIEERAKECYLPVMNAIKRAEQEMVIKAFPAAVSTTLTLDIATSLAQKHEAGFVEMTDELIERVVDALWEALRR
ncbi:MAG: TetR/AcrR family transcriptional regulator [Caldilineaceae bacterium]|nr:TetR/AcrR family transcriptional regulator [Caldilineaceae bacterium]